jgi:hypothetical protein
LRDALRRADARGREVETLIAMQMQTIVSRHPLDAGDVLRGLLGNIVAVIFARSGGLVEAREVAEEVCAEMMRRVTEH